MGLDTGVKNSFDDPLLIFGLIEFSSSPDSDSEYELSFSKSLGIQHSLHINEFVPGLHIVVKDPTSLHTTHFPNTGIVLELSFSLKLKLKLL